MGVPSFDSSPLAANGKGNGNAKKRGGETNGHTNEHDSKRQKVAEAVDRTRWRMKAEGGRHTWHYLDDDAAVEKWPQSYADKWYLDLPLVSVHRGTEPSRVSCSTRVLQLTTGSRPLGPTRPAHSNRPHRRRPQRAHLL